LICFCRVFGFLAPVAEEPFASQPSSSEAYYNDDSRNCGFRFSGRWEPSGRRGVYTCDAGFALGRRGCIGLPRLSKTFKGAPSHETHRTVEPVGSYPPQRGPRARNRRGCQGQPGRPPGQLHVVQPARRRHVDKRPADGRLLQQGPGRLSKA